MSQNVDGSQAVRVETRLVGEQPYTQGACVFGGERGKLREVVLFQHVDAGGDGSIAVVPQALTGDGFVVAGQPGNQSSVIRMELGPRGHYVGDCSADGVDAGRSVGINGGRHKDDISIAGWVHPDGGSSED